MTSKRKPSRVERILRAQRRVALAHDLLAELDSLDPRFADALNDYRAALDERTATEQAGQ